MNFSPGSSDPGVFHTYTNRFSYAIIKPISSLAVWGELQRYIMEIPIGIQSKKILVCGRLRIYWGVAIRRRKQIRSNGERVSLNCDEGWNWGYEEISCGCSFCSHSFCCDRLCRRREHSSDRQQYICRIGFTGRGSSDRKREY